MALSCCRKCSWRKTYTPGTLYWQKNSKEVQIRQAVCLTRAGCLSLNKWVTVKLHNTKSITEEKKQVKEDGI